MNLEILHQRIQAPQSIQVQDINALRDLTVKYPFAQVFSLLYLKALVVTQDLNFDEELQKHAYRITDRSKLHALLQERHETHPVTETIAEAIEEIEAITENTTEPSLEVEVLPLPSVEEISESPAETAEFAKIEIPAEPEEKQEALPQELEKEIMAHVMASAYSLELEVNEEEKEESKPPVDTTQPRSFTSWLKLADENPSTSNLNKTKEILNQLKEAEANKKAVDKKNEPLNAAPAVEKEKKEFFSPTKTARESVREDTILYSETLANIFAAQGNYPKAILAFEQLMLTNPEKKLYFAQKIKDLKLKLDT